MCLGKVLCQQVMALYHGNVKGSVVARHHGSVARQCALARWHVSVQWKGAAAMPWQCAMTWFPGDVSDSVVWLPVQLSGNWQLHPGIALSSSESRTQSALQDVVRDDSRICKDGIGLV